MPSGIAIFELQVTISKRHAAKSGRRQSAIAGAAYRSGSSLQDEQTQTQHNYSKKQGVESSHILAPENAEPWVFDREQLWNAHEAKEKRKDSQIFREVRVALPQALNIEQNRSMALEWIDSEFVSRGMVADVSFHDMESHNPHAHIMLTMRELQTDGFGNKNRSWNNYESFYGFSKQDRKEMGLENKTLVEEWRNSWTEQVNKTLEVAGISERISDLSNAERENLPLENTNISQEAHHMEQKGIPTEQGQESWNNQIKNDAKRQDKALNTQLGSLYGANDYDSFVGRANIYWNSFVDLCANASNVFNRNKDNGAGYG